MLRGTTGVLLVLVGSVVASPTTCAFKHSAFHNTDTFEEWSISGATKAGSIMAGKQTLNPLGRNLASVTIKVIGPQTHGASNPCPAWKLEGTFSDEPSWGTINGTLRYCKHRCNETFINFVTPDMHFMQLAAGSNAPPKAHCAFDGKKNTSMFHEDEVEPGVWGDLFTLKSVNETVFAIHNLNGTFKDTVATIRVISGTDAIATADFLGKDGSRTTRTLRIEAEGDLNRCMSMSWTDEAGGHGDWEMGPDNTPDPRPCTMEFDEKGCHNAWMSKCKWCKSNDGAHQLCFTASKLPGSDWKCQ